MPGKQHIAVIVSAGSGQRMKTRIPKQYLELCGVPVLGRTLSAFDLPDLMDMIILVIPEADHARVRTQILAPLSLSVPVYLTDGGDERQDSVACGLEKALSLSVDPDKTAVCVHDGVRPFVTRKMIQACLEGVSACGACIPGLALTDTVKQIDSGGRITATLDRAGLVRAQTPQTFRMSLLIRAFAHAKKKGFRGTDDASLVEYMGHPVALVKGDEANIKLTTPHDLKLGQLILEDNENRP